MKVLSIPFRTYATKLIWLTHKNGILDTMNKNTIKASKSISSSLAEGVAFFNSEKSLLTFQNNINNTFNGLLKKIHYSIDIKYQSVPEPISESLASLISKMGDVTHLIASTTSMTQAFLPRLGALLDVAPITDIIKIDSDNIFTRPIFAGNAHCKLRSLDPIKLMLIRASSFPVTNEVVEESMNGEVEYIKHENLLKTEDFKSFLESAGTEPENSTSKLRPELASAKIVVSGGRALGSAEKFQEIIYDLADALGAAVGASRAAVDSGFVPNEFQVGQTGKIVAPDLYFAIGISGAIQHVAGMKDSKIIVSINKDPEAPIFAISNYWIVGDICKIVPELTAAIRERQNK